MRSDSEELENKKRRLGEVVCDDMEESLEEDAEEVTEEKTLTLYPLRSNEIRLISASYLFPREAGLFAQTCRFLYKTIKPDQDFRKLVHHVILSPNEDIVTEMLSKNPALINAKISLVIDRSNRQLIGNTLLQLAYGASDHQMCLTLKKFFVKYYHDETSANREMEKQLSEKFNTASAEKETAMRLVFMEHFKTVFYAICQERFNAGTDDFHNLRLSLETRSAIKVFRTEFERICSGTIKDGVHFSLGIFVDLLHFYEQNAEKDFGPYSLLRKHALFLDAVCSSVLQKIPAKIAMYFCHGVSKLARHDGFHFEPACGYPETFKGTLFFNEGQHHYYKAHSEPSVNFSQLMGRAVDIMDGTGVQDREHYQPRAFLSPTILLRLQIGRAGYLANYIENTLAVLTAFRSNVQMNKQISAGNTRSSHTP